VSYLCTMYPSKPSAQVFAVWGLLLAAALLPGPYAGAQAVVEAALDSTQIQVGGTVMLRIRVRTATAAPSPRVDLGALDTLTGLEVLSVEPLRQKEAANAIVWEQAVQFISFDAGNQYIPALMVHWGDTVLMSEPMLFSVLLPKLPPDAALAPIKDIILEPKRFTDQRWPWALGGILLAGAAWWLWQKRRRKPKEVIEIPAVEIPPYEAAKQQLEALRKQQLWRRAPKRHYTELTDILRAYISRRFFIPALSETSTGILDDLAESSLQTTELDRLERILHTADLAKFAQAEPAETLSEQLMEDALSFVEATRPLESPKPIAP